MNMFLWPICLLFLVLPVVVRWLMPVKRAENAGALALRVPFYQRVAGFAFVPGGRAVKAPRVCLILMWVCFVLAAMRPVWYDNMVKIPQNARNIVLSLDVSGSMSARDFSLNGMAVSRWDMVKLVVMDFLKKRSQDNLGLVLFGSEAYNYAPLSFDLITLQQLLAEVHVGIAGRATAIGDGLAQAVQSALMVPSESAVVILLSDGYNNAGVVRVSEALDLALKNNVKVYTIGVGAESNTNQDFFGMQFMAAGSDLDEKTLQYIADKTGGEYFRAKSTLDLQNIYNMINKLEKSADKSVSIRPQMELFYIPLLIGMLFLFIAWILRRNV